MDRGQLSGGLRATVPRQTGYSALVADAMGYRLALDAQGGTGYLRKGSRPTFAPLIDRLPRDHARYSPSVIVVDAGRHDQATKPTQKAARSYFNRLNRFWPTAAIYLVVPYEIDAPAIAERAPWWHTLYVSFATGRANTYVIDPVAGALVRDGRNPARVQAAGRERAPQPGRARLPGGQVPVDPHAPPGSDRNADVRQYRIVRPDEPGVE